MRNFIVGVQMLTYVSLAILFWRDGNHRLAIAQGCYLIAAGFLFLGVKS
jgi:hypothetical protein